MSRGLTLWSNMYWQKDKEDWTGVWSECWQDSLRGTKPKGSGLFFDRYSIVSSWLSKRPQGSALFSCSLKLWTHENLTYPLSALLDRSKGTMPLYVFFCFVLLWQFQGQTSANWWLLKGKCLIKGTKTRSCLAEGWFTGSLCLKLIRVIYLTF